MDYNISKIIIDATQLLHYALYENLIPQERGRKQDFFRVEIIQAGGLKERNDGTVAQRLERPTHNRLVVGSNPTSPTLKY